MISIAPSQEQAAKDGGRNAGEARYAFHHVFDGNDHQSDMYEEVCEPLLDTVLDGGDVVVFTYGQTGSGKTYTILGDVDKKVGVTPNSGIFVRAMSDLLDFRNVQHHRGRQKVELRLGIVEIYLEDLRDLQTEKLLKVMNNEVQGMEYRNCASMSDVLATFTIAQARRVTQATGSNDQSSRSHALFFVQVVQTPLAPDANGKLDVRRSQLILCDLAGSERLTKSQADPKVASFINQSLTTLSKVIRAISHGELPTYRESVLTRILGISIMKPQSKVVLITNLSPSNRSFEETSSSLRFANNMLMLEKLPGFENVSVDVAAEENYKEAARQADAAAADVRIAMASHGFHLSTAAAGRRVTGGRDSGAAAKAAAGYQTHAANMRRAAISARARAVASAQFHQPASVLDRWTKLTVPAARASDAVRRLETTAALANAMGDIVSGRKDSLSERYDAAMTVFVALHSGLWGKQLASREEKTAVAMSDLRRLIAKVKDEAADADVEEERIVRGAAAAAARAAERAAEKDRAKAADRARDAAARGGAAAPSAGVVRVHRKHADESDCDSDDCDEEAMARKMREELMRRCPILTEVVVRDMVRHGACARCVRV